MVYYKQLCYHMASVIGCPPHDPLFVCETAGTVVGGVLDLYSIEPMSSVAEQRTFRLVYQSINQSINQSTHLFMRRMFPDTLPNRGSVRGQRQALLIVEQPKLDRQTVQMSE